MPEAKRDAPLSRIRVLDLSRVLAGPWATQLLADLGAEVIKVERPGRGDDTRGWGPPFLEDEQGRPTGETAYYLSANRGKKSLTLDLSKPRGQEIARALAARSDMLVENYKVGGLVKYGLDYASLKPDNPRLIYCSITGFGQTGPYRLRPGYDYMGQGMGGLMSITGEPEDKPGGGPLKVGIAVTDLTTGLYATIALLAALAERERSGRGQYIDLALLDTQVAWLANQGMNYLVTGEPPGRLGNAHPNIVPYQTFATADGYVIVAVGNEAQFARLMALAGRPELAEDERFDSNDARVRNRDALIGILEPIFLTRSNQAWLEALEANEIACGPINTIDKVFADPQVEARGMRIDLAHPLAGTVPGIANPIKFSDTPIAYRHAPPLLGQHSEEVLREVLRLDDDAIATLRRDGVI